MLTNNYLNLQTQADQNRRENCVKTIYELVVVVLNYLHGLYYILLISAYILLSLRNRFGSPILMLI